MKAATTLIMLIALTVLFVLPASSYAQVIKGDTMYVYALPPGNLDNVILGDTTSTGQRADPNRVYVLQQTGPVDTTYFFTDILKPTYDLRIIGKNNPITGRPPVIEPFINSNNGSPYMFCRPEANLTVEFKNIYFLATRPDGTSRTEGVEYSYGDSITVILDHDVFENFEVSTNNGLMITFRGQGNKIFMTNCEFRDNQTGAPGNPPIIWQLRGVALDTAIIKDNTFFCGPGTVIGDPGSPGYLLFDHNTVFMGSGGCPILIRQLSNAVVENNIFYATDVEGQDSTTIKSLDYPPGPAVVILDSLTTLDTLLTESQRNVVIKNNDYYWPKACYTYWKTLNDTASANGPGVIVPPKWMSDYTAQMFADHSKWPGFSEANNDSTDPGFSSSLVSASIDSMVNYLYAAWENGGITKGQRWFQYPMDPANLYGGVAKDWESTQGYPVPENLKYSNTALYNAGTDGKPLGDLNWFPNITDVKQIPNAVPSKFQLSQNYPNPFNPTTDIKYEIPKSGFVSLSVYNILGQKVATLFNGYKKAGSYQIEFNASTFASGVYFYNMKANGFSQTKKMILLK